MSVISVLHATSSLLRLLMLSSVLLLVAPAAFGATADETLENERYAVRLRDDASIEVVVKGAGVRRVFAPRFLIMHRPDDPDLHVERSAEEALPVPAWELPDSKDVTLDFFEAATPTAVRAVGTALEGDAIRWVFPEQKRFHLEAEVRLPPGQGAPQVAFRFTPRENGWYSIGYAGAPDVPPAQLEALWQPLIWQEQRFPRRSFLSVEASCPTPATWMSTDGTTVGVAVDPAELPFRMPTFENSRFGVLLRNEAGRAQPMIFAPVLGQPRSRMRPGRTFSFRLRLIVHPRGSFETLRHVARNLYGFHDYRRNATGSLNETIENMVAFAMNDAYSGWNEELKAFDYTTDVPGTVKMVSALHPLSIAMIMDSEEIFQRRVLPLIEYAMSREKYLFSVREGITHQSPSHFMDGPSVKVSELAALYLMSQRRSTVFRHYARALYDEPRVLNLNMVIEGGSWQRSLALYRMTGDQQHLKAARAGADAYIERRIDRAQTDFSDVHVEQGGQFFTDFAPKWVDLLELYEETKDERYLKAAAEGARLYAYYIWMTPPIPERGVVVNEGDSVGIYSHFSRRLGNPQPMHAPEQSVPAWRISQIGLTPEASTTHLGNPAVLLTHYAAYMLRLADYTGTNFFRDIARSAVVGRYMSYPGYDINGEFTTVYQQADYPLRPLEQLTYNQIYYNHVWPHIALLMDYLISDAITRSEGQIHFPSRYAQGYAYLQSKVYGDRPGAFYGDEGVRLWMPADLLRTSSIQINYVAAYGNGNVYLALLNQSEESIDVTVALNPEVVPVDTSRVYEVQVWKENEPAAPATLRQGEVTVPVAGKGITALVIEGLEVTPELQRKIFAANPEPLSEESYATTASPFGEVTGMIISFGPTLTSGYIWLEATEENIEAARLHYEFAEKENVAADEEYPYEFSLPLSERGAFSYYVEGIRADGTTVRSKEVTLRR